jgi:hypothetical protein
MNTHELRIGNWVEDYDSSHERFRVETITKGENGTEGMWFINGRWHEDVIPTPLTEELLGKCGFKMTSNYSPEGEIYSLKHRDGISFEVCISYKGVDIIQNIGRIRMLNIKYLHQLQNVFFILTGEELKIEL